MPATPVQVYSATRLDPYMDPELAKETNIGLRAGDTPAAGTVMGEVSATLGTYRAYASGNVDGSQNPSVILRYTAQSVVAATAPDTGNYITYIGDYGLTAHTIPAFYTGTFLTSQLVGLDANAVTKMGGLLIEGSVTAGVFRF